MCFFIVKVHIKVIVQISCNLIIVQFLNCADRFFIDDRALYFGMGKVSNICLYPLGVRERWDDCIINSFALQADEPLKR